MGASSWGPAQGIGRSVDLSPSASRVRVFADKMTPTSIEGQIMVGIAQPYGYRPVTQRPYSGTAITAFVFSLLWLGGLGSLAAIIFAAVSMRKTRTHDQAGRGLAVAALIIGILGLIVAVWIVLVVAAASSEVSSQFAELNSQLP